MRQSESEASAVPARATQGAETRVREWSWVEASIWTERMLAALENGVRGGCWYSLIDKVYRPSTLQEAWRRVAANGGAAGVDGQSIAKFRQREEVYLAELGEALKQGSYRPQPVKRVEIPKGNGQVRPLGIPAVKDRIVQMAIKLVIEPIFEWDFQGGSYGFRPGRGCKDALREVDRLIKAGYTHVVDADLVSCFDQIPQEGLMQRLQERISDGRVLALIDGFLKQDIIHELQRWTPTRGTPQGAVLSPLLANVYLDGLDRQLQARGDRMVRYADDFVVLCESPEAAQAALGEVRTWVETHGLTLHPDKTHVGDCRVKGQGFAFLGYHFEADRRYVRKKSLTALKDKIRAKTKRTRGASLRMIIDDLNPILKGWFRYFQHAHRSVFPQVDGFLRRRLRAILRKQSKRPGFGRCHADHVRWPNAFFAAQGLFTMTEARDAARQSR